MLALAIGTVVLVVFLLCVGEFMYGIGLGAAGFACRFLALFFLGIAPIAGLWDFTQRGHEDAG